MTFSLILACLWVLAASGVSMAPGRYHWPGAMALIVSGIPLLGLLTLENGPVLGLVALGCGMSVLRWPVFYGWRWVGRQTGLVAASGQPGE